MFRIRAGTLRDADTLLTVHRQSILELGRAFYSDAEVESWAAKLSPASYRRAMTEAGESFLVAESDDGGLVAFCSFRGGEVIGLYVDPAWARRGIGGALLARAEAPMRTAADQKLSLTASLSGQGFYQAKGYRVVARTTWTTRGGLEIATLRMEKSLDR